MSMALHSITGAIRILGNEHGYMPLPRNEQQWIAEFTQEGDRVIDLSTGVIEGDQLIITEGPLAGKAHWIKSINRHKRMAWLERISLTFSQTSGLSLHSCGTLSDHGRKPSTTSSVSSPALGISVSSHSM